METKTTELMRYFENGDYRNAFKIFKTFRIGFTKEEKRTIEIAYECLTGNSMFYKQVGISANDMIAKAKNIVRNKYNLNSLTY